MKLNLKKIFVILAVVSTLMLAFAFAASAELTYPASGWVQMYGEDGTTPFEGVEGTDLRWTVDKVGDEVVLTITGTNPTLTFNSKASYINMNSTTVPWWSYAGVITKLVIEAPITAINQTCAFNKLEKVHTVVLPETNIKLSSSKSMIFAGMKALTTMGPEGTEKYTLDLRTLYGGTSQPFDSSCENETENTITVLMPYGLTCPMNSVKPFSNETKILFKVLKDSPSESVVRTIETHANDWENYTTSNTNVTPHTKYVTVEYYDVSELKTVKGGIENKFEFTLDLETGALVVLNKYQNATDWKQFDTHSQEWQAFKSAWGSYVKTATVDKFDKISYGYTSDTAATPLFAGMENLETVKFQSSQRMQNGSAASCGWFQGCTALRSVTFGGTLVDGVCDLSGMSLNSQDSSATYLTNIFNGCENIAEVILHEGELMATIAANTFAGCTNLKKVVIGENITTIEADAFADSSSVVLHVYENSAAHTWANTNGVQFTFIVKEEVDENAPITGRFAEKNDLTYHFDPVTQVLTISGNDTVLGMDYPLVYQGHCIKDIDGDGITEMVAQLPWLKFGFADQVKEVVIDAPLTKIEAYMLTHMKKCEKVTIPATLVDISENGVFAYSSNLDTVVIAGKDAVDGVIDFTNIELFNEYTFDGALQNVTPKILFGENLEKFAVTKMAQKCQELKICGYGDTPLASFMAAYLAGDYAENSNVCKNISFEYDLFAPVVFEAYSIRLADYNGLRGIFSVSDARIALVEKLGYTVKEYGTIAATAANGEAYGLELTGSDYATANDAIIKTSVYQNGEIVSKQLEPTEGQTNFALSIINIPETHYNTELVMRGYAILVDAEGKESVVYSDSNSDSIYDVAVGMYEDGVFTEENGGIAMDIVNYGKETAALPVAYSSKRYL